MKRFFVFLVSIFAFFPNRAISQITPCDFIIYNTCVTCDTPYAFEVGFDENCRAVCANRDVYTEGSGYYSRKICFLKKCPDNKPFRNHDGSCYEDGEHVPNINNQYKDFYDVFSDDNLTKSIQIPAHNHKCSPKTPLLKENICFSCLTPENLAISREECNKCPNRKYIYSSQWKHGECVLPCPPDKPLKRWDGKCFSCSEEKTVNLETWCNFDIDCDVCPNRTIIHKDGGNIPSILNCPKEKPLMDSHGICYSCKTSQRIDVRWNKDVCTSICPHRHLNTLNDSCVL